MIQDIYPHHFDNTYKLCAPKEGDKVFHFSDDKVLVAVGDDGAIAIPSYDGHDENCIYLFSIDERRYFLCLDGNEPSDKEKYRDLRQLRDATAKDDAGMFAVYSAYHLWKWYDNERYCGHCGRRLRPSDRERALVCDCGNTVYPRINPAVIIAVIDEDRIILTKYRVGYGHNALVAGFCEFGETLEDTVAREVMEEVGLKVKDITYYKSQPWGIAQDILAGFACHVDGSKDITVDGNELKSAVWTKREDIILQPNNFSLTNEMMMRFKEGYDFFK